MELQRKWTLTIGPVLLVATCYAIAAPARPSMTSRIAEVTADEPNEPAETYNSVSEQCETTAKTLREKLLADWAIIIHEPYVVAGDMTDDELEHHYQQTIGPTAEALKATYFRSGPRHAVTILLCSSDEQFGECNFRLDDLVRNRYSGIYSRKHRRIIVNIASGDGTLAHELTHALAHADFPKMPEWFDEGLASLHEECEFSVDGHQLIGNANWRQDVALEALHHGELRLLEDIASNRFGSLERANVDYSHVRSLCLFLQERGRLEAFYHTCRMNISVDPTGLRSLCAAAEVAEPKTLDDAFRSWLISRKPGKTP